MATPGFLNCRRDVGQRKSFAAVRRSMRECSSTHKVRRVTTQRVRYAAHLERVPSVELTCLPSFGNTPREAITILALAIKEPPFHFSIVLLHIGRLMAVHTTHDEREAILLPFYCHFTIVTSRHSKYLMP